MKKQEINIICVLLMVCINANINSCVAEELLVKK